MGRVLIGCSGWSYFARWAEVAPDGFVFAVKVSRYLTHVRGLREVADGMARLAERLVPLAQAGKLGPLLWQLPPAFERDDQRLLAALAAFPPGRHAIEFRHPSWFAPEVLAQLAAHDVALVIGDHPERPFQPHELTTSFAYLRFHHGRAPGGDYGEGELGRWAERLAGWSRSADVFAYFNNDWEAFAIKDALRLEGLVATSAGGGSDQGPESRAAMS